MEMDRRWIADGDQDRSRIAGGDRRWIAGEGG